jgi:hypothetical protein
VVVDGELPPRLLGLGVRRRERDPEHIGRRLELRAPGRGRGLVVLPSSFALLARLLVGGGVATRCAPVVAAAPRGAGSASRRSASASCRSSDRSRTRTSRARATALDRKCCSGNGPSRTAREAARS